MWKQHAACCSTPASMCYWLGTSVVAWGLLSLVGLYWHPLRPEGAGTIVIGMGIGCVANWVRNRTFHCGITAPLLLIAGMTFMLSDARAIHVEPRFVWPFVAIGAAVAFLLEWRYASRSDYPETRQAHDASGVSRETELPPELRRTTSRRER